MVKRIDFRDSKTLITTFFVLFVLISIPLTVISVITMRDERSKAAGTTVLYLSPANQSYPVGSDIVVQVRENSGTVPVTTVDASFTYDATKMDFVSIDPASSGDFPSEAVTASGGGGLVSFTRFVTPPAACSGTPPCPGTVTGDRLVATVHFKAKLTIVPSTTLNFVTGLVYQASDASNSVVSTPGATYSIVDQPPTINITSPSNGALVNGSSLVVTANATDIVGVSKVDFYLDNSNTPITTDTTPNAGTNTYPFNLNTTTLTNTTHTIKAMATDTNGGTSTSQISVTVDNSPPTISITNPLNGQKISKTFVVSVIATDNRSVSRVDFYVDNGVSPKFSTTTAPYSFNWDTTLETSAQHILTAKAFDGINTTTSAAVLVTVDNIPPTPPILSGSAVSQTQINLSWTPSTDSQGSVSYDLYRNNVKLNSTPLTLTTYSDTSLTASTSYSYFIQASDQVGNTTASNTLTITTPAPWKIGDINHDGFVNSADLAILLSTWGSTTDLRADLNGNGKIDSNDLAMLLTNWSI